MISPDRAAMGFDQVAADRQAKTQTAKPRAVRSD
jgi:hypothetical protein